MTDGIRGEPGYHRLTVKAGSTTRHYVTCCTCGEVFTFEECNVYGEFEEPFTLQKHGWVVSAFGCPTCPACQKRKE
jgi:Fe2+ or Zn2+ uptake regulation protein